MAEPIETATSDIVIPDLIDDFRNITALNGYMEAHGFDGAITRRRDDLAEAIGEKIVGHRIGVTELPIAKETGERAIEHLSIANPMQSESLARSVGVYDPNRRLHPATHKQYLHHDFFRYRKHSRSKVEAIDGPRSAIVARPRLALFDRAWIRVVNAEGEPLVDLSIDE